MKKTLACFIFWSFFGIAFSQNTQNHEAKLFLWAKPNDFLEYKEFHPKNLAIFENVGLDEYSHKSNHQVEISFPIITMYTTKGDTVHVLLTHDQYEKIKSQFPIQDTTEEIVGISYNVRTLEKKNPVTMNYEQKYLFKEYKKKIKYILNFENPKVVYGAKDATGKILLQSHRSRSLN